MMPSSAVCTLISLVAAFWLPTTAALAQEPVTVTGQVLDPEGQPVANAALVLTCGPSENQQVVTGQTGPDGRFSLQYVPGEQVYEKAFQLWALADGHGIGVASGSPAWPEATIDLTRPASISGTVTTAGGEPVSGARVLVRSLSYTRHRGRLYAYLRTAGPPLRSETNVAGRFRIGQLPAGGSISVIIEAEGYPYFLTQITAPQRGARIVLPRGGLVSGRVLHDGQPVAGIAVAARPLMAGPRSGWGEATSAQDGAYEFRLAPGTYNVMLDPPDGLTAAAHENVEVKPGDTIRGLELQLIEGGLVTGRVRDADTGDPIAGAAVAVYGPARPLSSGTVQSADTDEQGRYELRVPPGSNRVYYQGGTPGYSVNEPRRRFIQVAEGDTIEGVDFELKRLPVLRGRVLGPDGQPVAGAKLWDLNWGGPARRTDDQGRFEKFLAGGEAPRYVYITNPDDSLGGFFWHKLEDQTTEFRLQPLAALVGRVRDTAGQPVEGISVQCNCFNAELQFIAWGICIGESDAEGKVELPMLPPSLELKLQAETKGLAVASEWPEAVTLEPGETRDMGVLTINLAGRSVSGVVRDADKDVPAPKALVVDLHTGRETLTDERGRFELSRLHFKRPALLLARDSTWRFYVLREVDPEKQQTVDLLLRPLASVEGYVVNQQWQPVAGAEVVARMGGRLDPRWTAAGERYLPPRPETRTDKEGHYHLRSLLHGMSYVIHAEADEATGFLELTAEGGPPMAVADLVIWPQQPIPD